MSSDAEEVEEELRSLVTRVDKWGWEFRAFDMINVDLGLIPTVRTLKSFSALPIIILICHILIFRCWPQL